MNDIQFSVLDLIPHPEGIPSTQAFQNSLDLAQQVEKLGFHRVWYAEHHNLPTVLSSTPEIMIGLAGSKTQKIRLGSGGVMLPNHAPLKVAESYKMLEALHPGRIDLGIGRAPGTDQQTALALRGSREALYADDFPENLESLVAFGRGYTMIKAVPNDVPLPPIFLLSSSGYSAHMAARLGMGFGFAAHFSDLAPDEPMLDYRREFKPQTPDARPHAILTLSVVCAETDAEAERLSKSLILSFVLLRTGQKATLLPPDEAAAYQFSAREMMVANSLKPLHIVGSPATVKRRIESVAARTKADEVMITTFVHGHAERVRSYELLSEAFALRETPTLQPAR